MGADACRRSSRTLYCRSCTSRWTADCVTEISPVLPWRRQAQRHVAVSDRERPEVHSPYSRRSPQGWRRSCLPPVPFNPGKKSRLVNQYAAPDTANDRVETVVLRVKNEMPQATEWRPRFLLCPLLNSEVGTGM